MCADKYKIIKFSLRILMKFYYILVSQFIWLRVSDFFFLGEIKKVRERTLSSLYPAKETLYLWKSITQHFLFVFDVLLFIFIHVYISYVGAKKSGTGTRRGDLRNCQMYVHSRNM